MTTQLAETIEGFRLSPQQRRLWSLMDGDVGGYRTWGCVRVEGPMDGERLRDALADLVAQHEILRTVFACPSGLTIPLQVIHDAGGWHYEEIERSGRDEPTVLAELKQRARGVDRFELESGPLLRVRRAMLSAQSCLLSIELPTLCTDAAGLIALVRELGRCYAGEAASDEERLQHVDLSEWLNEALEGDGAEAGQEFWQGLRATEGLELTLPFENLASSASQPFGPSAIHRPLAAEWVTGLTSLAQDFEVDRDDLALTGWRILLERLLAGSEPVLGVTSGGRGYAELEHAIGPFARVLPVRCPLERGMTLSDAASTIRRAREESESWLECFAWPSQDASKDGAMAPFLPFVFESTEETLEFSAGDVSFSLRGLEGLDDRFRVKLTCRERAGGLTLDWQYDPQRFSRAVVRGLAERLELLLAEALEHPETPIGELDVSGGVERHRLQVELNDTATSGPTGRLVHQQFARVARERPTAPAIAWGDQSLTYAELTARVEGLTRRLAGVGAGPGSAVALCLERSPAVPVAILGTLASGACYAPLEPEQPASRRSAMLAELRPVAVITHAKWRGRFAGAAAVVFCLDADGSRVGEPDTDDDQRPATPSRAVEPEDVAYVLFTSGSTGRPKGVAVEHRQLLNHLQAVRRQLDLPAGGRFALVSTFAADLANTMLFPALTRGGCLDILPEDSAVDPQALARHFERWPADCLKIVPSHLRALLSAAQPARLLPRRHLVVGGEALSWELAERVFELASDCRLWNAYGPTEATVEVTLHEVKPSLTGSPTHECLADTAPIGRPVAETSFHLVDDRLRSVPAGVAGELLIGGASLARGYLGRPAKTALAFIPNAFGRSGGRLYRSGDLARMLADGIVEFLGRLDQQVKIHGFRVELGEIEAALGQHSAVRDALAVLDVTTPGSQRLVAYLILEPGEVAPKVEALRAFLAERLLEPMIPAVFAVLESFPLTPNGKLDRRALPAPDEARMRLSGTPVPPRTPVEAKLVAIWQEVLGLDEIGIQDNFFALGGDSILSIQAVARANQEGLHLTPLDLFQHQTVARLAPVAEVGEAVVAEQDSVVGELPLTPIQHRFFERRRIEPWHWNQSLMLKLRPAVDPDRLEAAIGHLLVQHDALRSRFAASENGIRQTHAAPQAEVPLTRIDLSVLAAADRSAALDAAACQAQRSLDLADGPMLRASCFELGGDTAPHLLLVVHHLAVDAVSWRLLLEDLAGALEDRRLPLKTTSYKAWAERLMDAAEDFEPQAGYWLGELPQTGDPLPVDTPGAAAILRQTETVTTSFDADITAALMREVPAAHRTAVEELLVAALAQTLKHWMGAGPVLVELEGHGRSGATAETEALSDAASGDVFDGVDLSRTTGWFTTVYPVLLEVPAEDGALVRTVKEKLRSVPQRGIGYGILRYLGGDEIRRRLAERPQPEVRFNYLGQLDGALPEEAPFQLADRAPGPERSSREPFLYRLDLIAFIQQGRLQVDWTYPSTLYRRSTVESLTERWSESVRRLTEHCRAPEEAVYVPSDFPEAELSSEDLSAVFDQLGEVGEL